MNKNKALKILDFHFGPGEKPKDINKNRKKRRDKLKGPKFRGAKHNIA